MAKRKRDDIKNEGIKLRSGRALNTFPYNLDRKLAIMLQDYKGMTSEDSKHARELLDIISESDNVGYRFIIAKKTEEVYSPHNLEKITPIMGVTGALAHLLIDYPQYHDVLAEKMKNFDLETPLAGNIEE